jgi:hypothetical protein
VAFIAFQHLNSTAKAAVDQLLKLNPQFDTRTPAGKSAARLALVL